MKRGGPWRVLLAIAVIAACEPGCSSPPARRPPNVLFISFDTLRSDHCSAYGYHLPTTPRMAALAREGVRFEAAYSPTSTTGPSHATMFTGLYPLSHGVVENGTPLPDSLATLAEILKARGYQTAAFVSSFVVQGRFGFAQGFDTFDDRVDHRRAASTTAESLQWLQRRDAARPFFVWVHYIDPHSPYDPPEPYRTAFAPKATATALEREVAAYDGEIAYADREMGRLLDWIGGNRLRADTLVVVTADHGEGLMQRGHMGHGLFLHEEGVRVPLLFRWPGRLPEGRSLAGPVELVDLLPTVLDLAGLPSPGRGLQGQTLAPVMAGTSPDDQRRRIFLQRRRYQATQVAGFRVAGSKFAIRAGSWKYIEAREEGTRELFHLVDDPGEVRNVAGAFPDKATDLAAALQRWRSVHDRTTAPPPLTPDTVERLRALGYVQ